MSLTNDDLKAIEKIVDKIVERKLTSVKRDLKTVVSFFDHEFLDHEKRIRKLENSLSIYQND